MKKIKTLFLSLISLITLASCNFKSELIILNWGEYMSQDLIKAFEEEYDCYVNEISMTSNELMFADIVNHRIAYDLAIPSDYMIDKLQKANLLKEIDFSRLENYKEGMFVDELEELMYNEENSSYKNYYIPYFWGSLGIMYSTKNYPNIGQIIEENGFAVFFEDNLLPKDAKVAMYGSSRDAFAAAELYLGYSLNTTNKDELDKCSDLIKSRNFKIWGTDDLKTGIVAGNIDVALVYSGDFFDAYYMALEEDTSLDIDSFDIFAPTTANNVFYDGIVMPTTSSEEDLAYKFLDFILDYDNSLENTDAVGYCPTVEDVYNYVMNSEDWLDITKIEAYNPALVVNEAKDKAEVYKDLGNKTYKYMEELYNKFMIK